MKVYRIEHHEKGLGPYQGGAIDHDDTWEYFSSRHPGPNDDGITGGIFLGEYFGFSTMRQMFQWFNWRDIFRWRKKGFRVYTYRMSNHQVRVGGRQVAFVRASALSRNEVKLAALAKHLVRIPLLAS